jgi:hypothetical protein
MSRVIATEEWPSISETTFGLTPRRIKNASGSIIRPSDRRHYPTLSDTPDWVSTTAGCRFDSCPTCLHTGDCKPRQASFLSGNLLGWKFSCLLNLVAGYGERPVCSFTAYLLVIFGFAVAFLAIGSGVLGIGGHDATNSSVSALVFSVTSFHGRGFFPGGGLALDDPITILAALEAIIGMFNEITFIATFTQRFFAR